MIDLAETGAVRVRAAPHPFKAEAVDHSVEPGRTLEEILEICQADPVLRRHAHIFVGDVHVPRELWARVRPKAGAAIYVRVVPEGGGGGKKNPLRTVLTIAVIVASFAFGGPLGAALGISKTAGVALGLAEGALQSAIGGAIISVAGNLLINAIAPPAKPKLAQLSGSTAAAAESPTLFVSGTRNQANPFGPVPSVLGKGRMVPPFGAKPYTEVLGDDQYFRGLYTWGYGPLEISDIKIGETPISEFEGVEIETRQGYPGDAPLTLFPGQVDEETLSVRLEGPSTWASRTTSADADEISVDVTAPQGIVRFGDGGGKGEYSVTVEVEYSPAGAGTWSSAGSIDMTANKAAAVRRGLRWQVSRGQYDVRLRRTSTPATSSQIFDDVFFSALRTITNEDPVKAPGIAKTAIRIKASGQLSGILDELNGIAQTIAPDYDSGSGTWIERATSNPASLARLCYQGPANARPCGDSNLDLAGYEDFHGKCVAAGREFNMIVDYQTSVAEILDDIHAAGRAKRTMVDGKWSLTIDEDKPVPVQLFTPRNSWGYQGSKAFPDEVHAWRVSFVNRDADFKLDERIVYDDGFDANTATKYEGLELPGITDPNQIYKDGRYHIATARLRPEIHKFYTDVEFIVALKGDPVRLQHDVPKIGLGAARVKARLVDDPVTPTEVLAVTLDEPIAMEGGKLYAIRFRYDDGTQVVANIDTNPGEQATVYFETPIAIAVAPAKGDLCSFGERGLETLDLIIKEMRPGPNLTAQIVAVDSASAVHDADAGPIPAFASLISTASSSTPSITAIRSDESVLVEGADGVLRPRILVEFALASRRDPDATSLEIQFRPSGQGAAWSSMFLPVEARSVSIEGVEQDDVVEIRARFLAGNRSLPFSPTHTETVVGMKTPPADPPELYLERVGGALLAKGGYPNPPRDLAGFRFKHRAGTRRQWEGAAAAHDEDILSGLTLDLGKLPAGTRTIMAKAVDQAGNESTGFASIIVGLGDPTIANIVATEDLKAAGFPGTVTNGSLIAGNLKADDFGSLYLPDDEAPYLPDGSALYLPVSYKAMAYEFRVTPAAVDTPSDLSLPSPVIAGETWSIDYRTAGDGLYLPDGGDPYLPVGGDPYLEGWSDWRAWPGVLEQVARAPYEFRISIAAGDVQGVISGLTAELDVDDISERFEDLAIAASGTRIPLTKPFRKIVALEDLAIQDESGSATAVGIRFGDKSTAGPLLYAVDAAGVKVTAVIDGNVRGY